jgi:hypothetical protein
MATVIKNWSRWSSDLNPIENRWTIMNGRIETLQPKLQKEIPKVFIDVWKSFYMALIKALAD